MQTITCKAAIAWEAEKPLEVVDIDVAPPQVTAPLLLSASKPSVLSVPDAVISAAVKPLQGHGRRHIHIGMPTTTRSNQIG